MLGGHWVIIASWPVGGEVTPSINALWRRTQYTVEVWQSPHDFVKAYVKWGGRGRVNEVGLLFLPFTVFQLLEKLNTRVFCSVWEIKTQQQVSEDLIGKYQTIGPLFVQLDLHYSSLGQGADHSNLTNLFLLPSGANISHSCFTVT